MSGAEESGSDDVSLEAAQKVFVDPPKPGANAEHEESFFNHTENMQNAQLGWIGLFWGAKSEKPGNVSAIIALLLAIYLGFLIFTNSENPHFGDIFSGLLSVVTLILGYLFGSSDRR